MAGQWSSAGTSPSAGQPGGAQRAATTISAVITALALIAVLVVALATSDDASGTGDGLTGSGGSGGGSSVGSSGSSDGSSSSGSGGSSGSGIPGSTSTQHSAVSPQYLKRNFPFPSGTTPWTGQAAQTGEKYYKVRATLAGVKAFYSKQLPAIGVPIDYWGTDVGGPGGSVRGYAFDYAPSEDPPFYLELLIDSLDLGHGLVTIEVTLVCGHNANPVTSPAC